MKMLKFDFEKSNDNIIKVFGVGGGGGNAVNYMFHSGIKDVDFVVCNTDLQALESSPIPNKVRLGIELTNGLGAGGDPRIGEEAALESQISLEETLGENTKMIFVTAGMGGGTGTGAAPVIAKIAKEKGILTVGIVTIPFSYEGRSRQKQAREGIEKLKKHVDSFIIIDNNKLMELHGDLTFNSAYSKADSILLTAARGIADVVTNHYTQNIDFNDVKTILQNSGSAVMGSAVAEGDDRADKVIEKALNSPLLKNNTIRGAKKMLLLIVGSNDAEGKIKMEEVGRIVDYIHDNTGDDVNIIQGIGELDRLSSGSISVTVVATGFDEHNGNTSTLNGFLEIKEDLQASHNRSREENFYDKGEDHERDGSDKEQLSTDTDEITSDREDIAIKNENDDRVTNMDIRKSSLYNDGQKSTGEVSCQDLFDFDFEKREEEKQSNSPNSETDTIVDHKGEEFLIRTVNEESDEDSQGDRKFDPTNCTIDQLRSINAKNRKHHMNNFNVNYQSGANIRKMEKEPAYRRKGVNIDHDRYTDNITKSSSSISTDKHNDIQIRTNNSFLHDNVD